MRRAESGLVSVLLILAGSIAAQKPPENAVEGFGGTSWRLIKFQSGDGKVLEPDTRIYTIAFEGDGTLSVRIDCNRGRGTWKSAGPNQLEFGPLALTRAMCPAAPLNDRFAKDWEYVRSYTLKDGHLFLSLMADGGTYEFDPLGQGSSASGHIKGTAAYRERMALPPAAVFEATLEDVSRADAPAEVIGRTRIDHPGNPPIAFNIAYEPSRINANNAYSVRASITDGDRLIFTTTQSNPVLTRNHGNEVKLLLQRSAGSAASGAAQGTALQDLPATFVGTLPCADCPGIRYQLKLKPDHTFSSSMKYEERNASLDDRGRWELADGGKVIVLNGSRNSTDKFAVRDSDRFEAELRPQARAGICAKREPGYYRNRAGKHSLEPDRIGRYAGQRGFAAGRSLSGPGPEEPSRKRFRRLQPVDWKLRTQWRSDQVQPDGGYHDGMSAWDGRGKSIPAGSGAGNQVEDHGPASRAI